MADKQTTIRVQALNGSWTTLGAGEAAGIRPENVSLSANTGGPSVASFDLKRRPQTLWPDLSAGAPVEIDVGSVTVWDGYITSTPTNLLSQTISVQCEGWQNDLDWRVIDAGYVHTDLSEWKDARTNLNADLTSLLAAWRVGSDNGGAPSIAFPRGQAANGSGSIYLDAGPGRKFARITWTGFASTWAANNAMYVLAGNAYGAWAYNSGLGGIAAGVQSGSWTPTVPCRVLAFRVDSNSHTPAADEYIKFESIKCYTTAAYESGGGSILKATDVIKDALSKASPNILGVDQTGVGSTSFSIPALWPDRKGTTARTLINTVNAYHNWTAKVLIGRKFYFAARAAAAAIKVGSWSAVGDAQDASTNSLDDIYNHCRASSSGVDGATVNVDRFAGQATGAAVAIVASPAADNPSMDTNTATWSTTAGVLTRDTTTYDTAPASLRLDGNGAGADLITSNWLVSETLTGPFRAGVTYAFTLRWRASFGFVVTPECTVFTVGSGTDTARQGFTVIPSTFTSQTIYWTPTADRATATFTVKDGSGSLVRWFDSLTVGVVQPTILDKWGRIRSTLLDVSATLPSDGVALTQLADTYLAAHATTPFRGTLAVQGNGAVREVLSGDPVGPETLLARTDEPLLFEDRVNPDSGNLGREGKIVAVTYTPADDTAKIDVDSSRNDFEALLVRLGAIVGATGN